jgi:hypothetical protein
MLDAVLFRGEDAMRKLVPSLLTPVCLVTCLLATGCAGVDRGLRNTVVLHYQHVANVERIDFTAPVALPRRSEPVHFVRSLVSEGFWAVFVLCSVDASGVNIPSFYFDIDRFRVQYGGRRFGHLRSYSLRLDDTIDVNSHRDTPILAAAINRELWTGPPAQVFRHGFYGGLDLRFAIYVPDGLADYAGGQLPLRYEGAQTLALGNDHPPAVVESAGPGGFGVAAHCLP